MALIIVGVGSLLMVVAGESMAGLVGIALAFGLIVMALVYTIGPISGCHINPAVTIGVMMIKGMKPKDGIMYIVMQIIGAVIGGAILYYLVWDYASGWAGLEGSALTDTVQSVFQGASTGFWAEGVDNQYKWGIAAIFLVRVVDRVRAAAGHPWIPCEQRMERLWPVLPSVSPSPPCCWSLVPPMVPV